MRGIGVMSYFQRLPETADEARAIFSSFAQTTGTRSENRLLLGAEASESRLKAEPNLASYSHLHFATHGVIGNDLPRLSEPALILAWEEHEDGFLTAREVTQLKLNARLTVLSACNTGNGEYFAGEGLMGMGRAFMLAGSDRVLVSLWPVESFSTQRLMELFYARLPKASPKIRPCGGRRRTCKWTSMPPPNVTTALTSMAVVLDAGPRSVQDSTTRSTGRPSF